MMRCSPERRVEGRAAGHKPAGAGEMFRRRGHAGRARQWVCGERADYRAGLGGVRAIVPSAVPTKRPSFSAIDRDDCRLLRQRHDAARGPQGARPGRRQIVDLELERRRPRAARDDREHRRTEHVVDERCEHRAVGRTERVEQVLADVELGHAPAGLDLGEPDAQVLGHSGVTALGCLRSAQHPARDLLVVAVGPVGRLGHVVSRWHQAGPAEGRHRAGRGRHAPSHCSRPRAFSRPSWERDPPLTTRERRPIQGR